MLKKEIQVKVSDSEILRCAIFPEEKNLNAARFNWVSKISDDGIIFSITADDNASFRAAESSVLKLVEIFEKMDKVFSNWLFVEFKLLGCFYGKWF